MVRQGKLRSSYHVGRRHLIVAASLDELLARLEAGEEKVTSRPRRSVKKVGDDRATA